MALAGTSLPGAQLGNREAGNPPPRSMQEIIEFLGRNLEADPWHLSTDPQTSGGASGNAEEGGAGLREHHQIQWKNATTAAGAESRWMWKVDQAAAAAMEPFFTATM